MSKEVNVVASVGLEAVRVTLAMEERVGGCLTASSFRERVTQRGRVRLSSTLIPLQFYSSRSL